jgi:hypothetical protein
MDPKPEVIRHQIEETRGSLTEKLETLEGHVKQTISTVKNKVEDTVQAVTSTVEETVDTVKRTFDIPYQVQKHPYAMTGGALLAGATLGYMLSRRPSPERSHHAAYSAAPPAYRASGNGLEGTVPPARAQRSFFATLLEPLSAEFDKIKSTAIGALAAMARDALMQSVGPALQGKVEEIMNDLTRRFGGEPVVGRVLRPTDENEEAARRQDIQC